MIQTQVQVMPYESLLPAIEKQIQEQPTSDILYMLNGTGNRIRIMMDKLAIGFKMENHLIKTRFAIIWSGNAPDDLISDIKKIAKRFGIENVSQLKNYTINNRDGIDVFKLAPTVEKTVEKIIHTPLTFIRGFDLATQQMVIPAGKKLVVKEFGLEELLTHYNTEKSIMCVINVLNSLISPLNKSLRLSIPKGADVNWKYTLYKNKISLISVGQDITFTLEEQKHLYVDILSFFQFLKGKEDKKFIIPLGKTLILKNIPDEFLENTFLISRKIGSDPKDILLKLIINSIGLEGIHIESQFERALLTDDKAYLIQNNPENTEENRVVIEVE